MEIINFFNSNAGAIQAISTIVLALITVWYAFETQQMARIMKKQITSKIIIENISIGSQFKEQWFLKGNFHEGYHFEIRALFDIRNEGNGSGSLYKPNLIIRFKKNTEIISPKTKSYETYNHEDNGTMKSYDVRTINYGSSIFLGGGASERVELEYSFDVETGDQLKFIKEVQGDPSQIQYNLVTTDNLGKKYDIFVEDIFDEKNFGIN